ncbi:MAG: glycosyltransferase [Thermoleophilia bacterium]|nr:glycosyltransferase [Thermoleophilia bacterium]
MSDARVLLVSPWPWTTPHPVNEHVAELADGLVALREAGDSSVPQPIVVAPSADLRARRATRRALRELARGASYDDVFGSLEDEELALAASAPGEKRSHEAMRDWPLLALPLPIGPASVSLRAAVRVILERAGADLVHVHDPLANDLARFVVRRWSGLTVATFHDAPIPTVAATIAAPLRERVVDGVDRWLVDGDAASELLRETFGEQLEPALVPTGATRTRARGAGTGPVVVVGRGEDDEASVRDLVRDLAPLLDARPELTLTLLSRFGVHHRPVVPRALRGRVLAIEAPTREQADAVLAGAGAYLALAGTHRRSREEALAAGVPVVDVPTVTDDDARDTEALHVLVETALAERAPDIDLPDPADLARSHVREYESLRERIQVHIAAPRANEKNCVIDLHMHTSHSWDCATDPEALLYVAKQVGLTAVAVTDHNEISGALACAELAEEYGIQVIVGEEVKTSQGEVIGLFLTERIEPGLSWHETIERIRAQDGLVYVPHPFDRLHTIPDVHLLRDTLDEIDAFETYNARLPFDQYNRDAERFARKYNLVEGAGSDSHVVQGLGTAAVHMPAWDDKESFLVSLGQGEILKRPKSLLYLQGLKWVNDLTGRSKRLPAEAVGPDED